MASAKGSKVASDHHFATKYVHTTENIHRLIFQLLVQYYNIGTAESLKCDLTFELCTDV